MQAGGVKMTHFSLAFCHENIPSNLCSLKDKIVLLWICLIFSHQIIKKPFHFYLISSLQTTVMEENRYARTPTLTHTTHEVCS